MTPVTPIDICITSGIISIGNEETLAATFMNGVASGTSSPKANPTAYHRGSTGSSGGQNLLASAAGHPAAARAPHPNCQPLVGMAAVAVGDDHGPFDRSAVLRASVGIRRLGHHQRFCLVLSRRPMDSSPLLRHYLRAWMLARVPTGETALENP